MDQQNNHKKNVCTHKIPTINSFGLMKYPREKMLDPQNTHERRFQTPETPMKARWHDGTQPTKYSTLQEKA